MENCLPNTHIFITLNNMFWVYFVTNKLFNVFQVSIFAGALFIQLSLGWDMYISIVALLLITGIYTVLGKQYHCFYIAVTWLGYVHLYSGITTHW